MRAALWNGEFNVVEVVEVQMRAPESREIVVDMTAVVLCITDVMGFQWPPFPGTSPLPHIPGHGGIGIVSAIGSDVSRVAVGDLVLVCANPWCGECYACVRDRPDQCGALNFGGPALEAADGRTVWPDSYLGSYASQVLTREIQAVPLRTSASKEALAILADGGGGGLGAAFNVAPITPGAVVGVLGCGMTGLSYIQAARFLGAEQIIAIDPLPHRRELAERLGATTTFDAGDPDVVEKVKEAAGAYPAQYGDKRGVEFAFEATGDAAATGVAVAITRPTGSTILAGVPRDLFASGLPGPVFDIAMNGKKVYGCQWGETNLVRDIPRWTKLIEDGHLDFDAMHSVTFGLDDINDMIPRIDRFEIVAGVLDPKL